MIVNRLIFFNLQTYETSTKRTINIQLNNTWGKTIFLMLNIHPNTSELLLIQHTDDATNQKNLNSPIISVIGNLHKKFIYYKYNTNISTFHTQLACPKYLILIHA